MSEVCGGARPLHLDPCHCHRQILAAFSLIPPLLESSVVHNSFRRCAPQCSFAVVYSELRIRTPYRVIVCIVIWPSSMLPEPKSFDTAQLAPCTTSHFASVWPSSNTWMPRRRSWSRKPLSCITVRRGALGGGDTPALPIAPSSQLLSTLSLQAPCGKD